MNQKQALTQARKRWGKKAGVSTQRDGTRQVGYEWLGIAFMVEGWGPTWADAIEHADSRTSIRSARREGHVDALNRDKGEK